MGGRKTYSIDDMVGRTSSIRESRKKFVKSIKSKSSKEIVPTTIELFVKSDDALKNFVKIVDTFDFVKENIEKKPPANYNERKKIASNFWAEKKKKKDIETPNEIDRIIVNSLTKILKKKEEK